ncbi:hypothetical protein GALMADRAFT_137481 [Galerina marginata CBS 339.88]|uniref:F-box domain-containing protein n=1 Tax=Galerina marginata (strain CBS 339.88) TaxID=685588 RepID=A0A067TBG3_GALM3|nr:hypothetical protein GALMADRAFT_137481 [Galerina marginata CBS 339.88]
MIPPFFPLIVTSPVYRGHIQVITSSVAKSLDLISRHGRQRFPQELIDLLIEHIHQGLKGNEAQKALKACTLVSQSFSAKSRKYLLSAIVISNRLQPPEGELLNWLELESARRRQRLEDLGVLIESESDFNALIRKVHIQVESQTLFDSSSGLRSVLDALASHAKNLETLWITGDGIGPISWPRGRQSIARPLNNLLGSVKFIHLRISSLSNLSTDIFMRCPSARSFHLVSTTFRQAEHANSQSISHPSSLKQLDLQLRLNDFRENFSRFNVDLSNLQWFRLEIDEHRDVASAWDLIKRARPSLRSLELLLVVLNRQVVFVQTMPSLPAEAIDISKLPKLVKLRLNIHICTSKVMPPMGEIFVLLTHTTSPSQLQSLKIDLGARVCLPDVLQFLENGDPAWIVLNPNNLCEKHALLQSVSVKLILKVNPLPPQPGLIMEDMEKSLRNALLSLILPPPRTSVVATLNVDVVIC